MVNVSNYGNLMEAGVHIYEYKPGFIHAKMSYQMMNVQSAGQLILIIEVSIFTMNAVFF